jgi:hypothetical protein
MIYILYLWVGLGIISVCYLIDYSIRVDRRIVLGDILLAFVLFFSGIAGFIVVVCMSILDGQGKSINNIVVWESKNIDQE